MHFEKQNRDGKITIIAHANGNRQPLPALWLRERAPTPDQLDGDTRQRLINPHQFDVDLHLTAAEITGDALYLEFSDAYQAAYPSALLASWIEPPARLPEKFNGVPTVRSIGAFHGLTCKQRQAISLPSSSF